MMTLIAVLVSIVLPLAPQIIGIMLLDDVEKQAEEEYTHSYY